MAFVPQKNLGTPKGQNPVYTNKGNTLGNSRPGSVASKKGSTAVRSYDAASLSSGKGAASMGGVTLGTTRNQHHVAHRIQSNPNQGPGQKPRGNTA